MVPPLVSKTVRVISESECESESEKQRQRCKNKTSQFSLKLDSKELYSCFFPAVYKKKHSLVADWYDI